MEEVDEIKPQKRRIRGKGITEYETYGEWAKENGIRRKVA